MSVKILALLLCCAVFNSLHWIRLAKVIRSDYLALGYSNFDIIATPGDGYCFFLAVQCSIANYMKIHIPFAQMSNLIKNECCYNDGNIYLPYFNGKPEDYHYQLARYFNMKFYNSSVADLLPIAAANALNIQIFIITDYGHSFKYCPAFRPRPFLNSHIILHLHLEHYSVTRYAHINQASPNLKTPIISLTAPVLEQTTLCTSNSKIEVIHSKASESDTHPSNLSSNNIVQSSDKSIKINTLRH